MEIIQVLVILFVIFAYSRVLLRFKDKQMRLREFTFWTIIWAAVVIVAVLPAFTGWLSNKVGIGRPIDIAVYVSIVLVFYLIFRMYVKFEKLDQNITKLVRTVAIEKEKKKK
ncbi:DUF2304 family protein [archaeon]|nr:DUF2304 family protein [archaeon]MBL7056793.1 DUF2304 family protein [Candidatus Woesearchaeota archaeon]